MVGRHRHEVLLFDLGGVLVDFAGFEELARLSGVAASGAAGAGGGNFEQSEPLGALRERWIHSPSVHRFERGASTPERFAREFLAEWPIALSPEEFLAAFASWARGPYPGARALLAALASTAPAVRLAAFSNANALHTARHRADWGDLLDPMFFSDELGLAKPDPAAFARVIEVLGVPAHRVAYFDDTPTNVEAARRAGLEAHLTLGVDGLSARLVAMGLLAGDASGG